MIRLIAVAAFALALIVGSYPKLQAQVQVNSPFALPGSYFHGNDQL